MAPEEDEAAMLGKAEKQVNAKEHSRVHPECRIYSAETQKYPIYLMAR